MQERMRGRGALAALLCTVALGAAGLAASAAAGVNPAQLADAGWTCFNDPAAPRVVCSDPGHGRPVPGDPDPPPSYNFLLFGLDGTFIGTQHAIRADLYSGQPCRSTGGDYLFVPRIGYYRCEHF